MPGISAFLEAAHIISLALNSFDEPYLVRQWRPFLSKHVLNIAKKQAASTWDILRNWTGSDLQKLIGEDINTPRNAILMNTVDHREYFKKFKIWFEEVQFF